MNQWIYDDKYEGGSVRQSGRENENQERDRRDNAIRVVTAFKNKLEMIYPPMVAKEYLSLLFRQRGVPSVDMFTESIISSFRLSLGHSPEVTDTLRRIITLGKWSNTSMTIVAWTIEPVVATMSIKGNSINVAQAEQRYSKMIKVLEPLTTTTHSTTVVGNEIKGRWAGWITWMEYKNGNGGNPSCMNCNMCGPSVFFSIRPNKKPMVNMMMTPESIVLLHNYSRSVNTSTGATASLIKNKSTRLKIQAGLNRPRSTSLTLYGNGSMQLSGSPQEVPVLYPAMFKFVECAMSSNMVEFLKTLRRCDTSVS